MENSHNTIFPNVQDEPYFPGTSSMPQYFPEGLFIPHLTDMAASPGQIEKSYEKEVLNQAEAGFDR